MFHLDALSRVQNILVLESNTFEQVSIKQSNDPWRVTNRQKLKKSEISYYELRDRLVFHKIGKKLLLHVPSELIENVIRTCKDNVGHVGTDKTVELGSSNCYWIKQNTLPQKLTFIFK